VSKSLGLRPTRRAAWLRLAAAVACTIGVLTCATAARAGFFTPSTGRWCARMATSLNDCSYDTFAQCMATLSGIGGVCTENPQAPQIVDPPPPRKHRKRTQQ
jgi:hypothetical protein